MPRADGEADQSGLIIRRQVRPVNVNASRDLFAHFTWNRRGTSHFTHSTSSSLGTSHSCFLLLRLRQVFCPSPSKSPLYCRKALPCRNLFSYLSSFCLCQRREEIPLQHSATNDKQKSSGDHQGELAHMKKPLGPANEVVPPGPTIFRQPGLEVQAGELEQTPPVSTLRGGMQAHLIPDRSLSAMASSTVHPSL